MLSNALRRAAAVAGRLLVRGDNRATDIKGSRLRQPVARGIRAMELGIAPGVEPDAAPLAEVCAGHDQIPTAAIATFCRSMPDATTLSSPPLRGCLTAAPALKLGDG